MTVEIYHPDTLAELPEGYSIRPAVMADLPAVAAMINAASRPVTGRDEVTEDAMRHEWELTIWDIARYARVVESPAGEIAAYIEVWNNAEPKVRPFVWGRVHPQYEGMGIGTHLMEWAESLLREEVDQAPEGARVEMFANTDLRNKVAMQMLTDCGMQITRYFWHMVIAFDGAPPEPALPDGITIRSLRPGESEREAYRTAREAFRDHWGFVEGEFETAFERWEALQIRKDSYDPSLRFIALDGDQIAGTNLCMPDSMDDPEMGWVGTLGVRREYRGRGIARALLLHSFGAFYRRGKKRAGLGVDADSLTGATRLYESAGMHVEREFASFSKVLRDGEDISTQKAG